jgi:Secretion system C-terminal sorting domain
MKNYYLVLLLALVSANLTAQNKVLFEYDNAGNQIKRTLCLNCDPASGKTSKDIADLQKEDLQQFFPNDVISYYPNPVKEELYLSWNLVDEGQVSSIQIYTSTGKLIKTIPKTAQKNNQVLYFHDYPSDLYSVLLLYTNGDQKAIKIIKQ